MQTVPLPTDDTNAADYVVWRKTHKPGGSQAGNNIWRANFGRTAGSGAALPSAESLSAAVPEPATWTLLILAAASVHLRRRQRSRAPQNSAT